jgi:hypothetical protein
MGNTYSQVINYPPTEPIHAEERPIKVAREKKKSSSNISKNGTSISKRKKLNYVDIHDRT